MISIITPVHPASAPFLRAAAESLLCQVDREWTWLVGTNGGAEVSLPEDSRIRVVRLVDGGIGHLKRQLCAAAAGDLLLELDADDLLMPEAVARTRAAFAAGADVVYSDHAEFENETWVRPAGYPYASRCGWTTYEIEYEGHTLTAMRAPEATAHNLRMVYWAPNHLRAWRRSAYERVGGHDVTLPVADDHDLLVRLYLGGARFEHIDRCLYLYRVHGANTVKLRNASEASQNVYTSHFYALAEKWAMDAGLDLVDLCGGLEGRPGYVALDRDLATGVSGLRCDLDSEWPLKDSTVGVLRAHDAVEHLRDPVHTMNEAWRVLAHGGWFVIDVPSTEGLGAFCDPGHVSFWNRLSFRYYTDPTFARFVRGFRGRFQVSRLADYFPSDWHRENNVPYVAAHLIAIKGAPRIMGENLWTP